MCLLALNRTGNGNGACNGGSVSEMKSGHTLSGGAPTGVPVFYGLAPDGIHSVTFYFRRHDPLTALVISNVFILHNPRQRLGTPKRLVWRDASGAAVKTIAFP